MEKILKYNKKFLLVLVPAFLLCKQTCTSQKKDPMKVTKTIIPAAGLGTRLLPYTKTVPKEMIALGNKPAIQYIIEEGMHSAIENFFIILNKEKTQIPDYFSRNAALEKILKESNKLHLLDDLYTLLEKTELHYIEQPEPKGLGHAVLMAENQIANEYFSIMLPDDIVFSESPGIGQLIAIAQQYNASVIAVREVPLEKVSSYGIVSIKETIADDIFEIHELVEKPSIEKTPSQLAITGRYVLSPRIFDALKELQKTKISGELQLTDAIAYMMKQYGEKVLAYKIKGTLHDVGNPSGWGNAVVDMVKKKIL